MGYRLKKEQVQPLKCVCKKPFEQAETVEEAAIRRAKNFWLQ